MSTRTLQLLLASVFFVLGGWCLVAPGSVLALTVRPAYQSDAPIVPFLVGCFGAQALIAGLFAATARFTRTTFLAYGLALLPFLAFDYWFYAVTPILTEIGLADLAGNVIMLAVCWLGWRRTPADRARAGADLSGPSPPAHPANGRSPSGAAVRSPRRSVRRRRVGTPPAR